MRCKYLEAFGDAITNITNDADAKLLKVSKEAFDELNTNLTCVSDSLCQDIEKYFGLTSVIENLNMEQFVNILLQKAYDRQKSSSQVSSNNLFS